MKVKDAAMQAYPFIEPEPDENIKAYHPGMTMRDYFAAKAIEGHLCEGGWRCDQSHFDDVTKGAYRFADAMLKARK